MSSKHYYCDYDFPLDDPTQSLANDETDKKASDELFADGSTDLGPIISPEDEVLIKNLYAKLPQLNSKSKNHNYLEGADEYHYDEAWIQTYSGKKFFPLNPSLDSICIEDIAHALSMQCRFTGHSKFHYSVAQHSVLVSLNCAKDLALYGLLHDASEAYICDVASPIKRTATFDFYKKIEKKLQSIIFNKFGLDSSEPLHIKKVDLKMLATEARDLFPTPHPEWKLNIQPYDFTISQLSPRAAKYYFLHRFYELTDI